MTVELNLNRFDQDPAVPGGPADAYVQGPSTLSAITGHIAVGRYVLQLGEPCGAIIRDASRAERAHIRPRPTPVQLRPKLIRGLLDRRVDLAAALSALDAGLPIEVSGEPGIGKTAVLRHLAHHPRAASFADGIVYVSARRQSSGDLLQLLFEAFYESDGVCKPTEAEIRRGLYEKEALILLDDVQLARDELEHVLDIAPRSAFAVATRERCLWGEVRSLALTGLPGEDAVSLLEREIERSLDVTERSAAATLCAAIERHPLRIVQAAAMTREHGLSLDGWARNISPASLITHLMASVDEKQRRALLALATLPGVPLHAQHIAGIAEVADIQGSLMTLIRRGLVVSHQSRHRLADGVADRLRRSEDLKPWANRTVSYFTAWAERHQRRGDKFLEESEALLAAQQGAIDTRRWGEALLLGRLLEPPLVLGARWDAWDFALERCLAAAKATGDRAAEAWALHEMGSRAVCLGVPGLARRCLSQAVTLREALGDDAAAASSRRNLGFVLAPGSALTREGAATTSIEDALDLGSIRFRDEAELAEGIPKARSSHVVRGIAVIVAILAALAYLATPAGQAWASSTVAGVDSFLRNAIAGAVRTRATEPPVRPPVDTTSEASPVEDALTPAPPLEAETPAGDPPADDPPAGDLLAGDPPAADPPVMTASQAPLPDRASILIFTARPGPIAGDGPTEVCYAVSGALRVRIEPGLGAVEPATTLSCLRVAPIRTTTYELIASGRDGQEVRQRLVIVVR